MPESWLPEQGAEAPIEAGRLVVARAGEDRAFVLTASGGRVTVEPLDGTVPGDAIRLPAPGDDTPPAYEDGRPLPPFDEAPIFAGLDHVVGATVLGVLNLKGNPFGERAFYYEFVDGRLAGLRLTSDLPPVGQLGRTPPDGMQITWTATWDRWLEWRAGALTGEQFLEGAQIAGTWPYIALVQGLFEHDAFVAGRRALPPVSPDLALLPLVQW